VAYSKSKVDRAGRTIAERFRSAFEGESDLGDHLPDILEAMGVVEWWRSEHARPLSRVAANLRYYAAEHGKPVVAQRLKKFSTIAGKLLREPSMKLSRMADIGGVRAILPDQEASYRVARRLRRNWTITRVRNYVDDPKDDGYRALHLINRNRGRLIEVQLRTPFQDTWANAVEADARLLSPGLKFGGGAQELRDFYIALGELGAQAESGGPIDPTLFEHVKDLQRRADTFRESTQ
jgi:putative GTP pyrophosphokinase